MLIRTLAKKLPEPVKSVLRNVTAQFRELMPISYSARIANELRQFDNDTNVHDLPEIFHYWSNKYLGPEKCHPLGITDAEQFFYLYCQKISQHCPDQPLQIISIGSGNCDMETRLAKRLLDSGINNFRIECMDLNQTMLNRGQDHAKSLGLEKYILPVQADFNQWRPEKSYDLILAYQCLHHVLELENLFAAIKQSLNTGGYLLTSDMIGRNGHMRWPEALELVQEFWQELPDSYRTNRFFNRLEKHYINHDCSTSGFEGIRAQDILPLLTKNFQFELFIPFANIITPFVDRTFGHNFDVEKDWDRDFIDRVHARDELEILAGTIKPTQMIAALCNESTKTQLVHPLLTPEFCIRDPLHTPIASVPLRA